MHTVITYGTRSVAGKAAKLVCSTCSSWIATIFIDPASVSFSFRLTIIHCSDTILIRYFFNLSAL